MKIAFCADVHVGNHRRFGGPVESSINRRGRQVLAVFRAAQQRAVKVGASVFVVLGDLFDTDRPVPQLLARVRSDFTSIGPKMKRMLLVGNHDQTSDAPGDHALGPLAGDNAVVVAEPSSFLLGTSGERDTMLHLLPFRAAPAREWFADAVRTRVEDGAGLFGGGRPRSTMNELLGFHLGVVDGRTPSFLRGAHDAIEVTEVQRVLAECEIDAAWCGNWHSHDVWNTLVAQIMQLGALCPTGFDNAGVSGYGTLAVYDTEARTTKTYRLPGPRFLVRFFDESIDEVAAECPGDLVYLQLVCTPAQLDEGAARIVAAMEEGWIVDGEAVTDERSRAEVAQGAALAARDAGALAEALAAFVGKMTLPPGVEPDRVLELAMDYLKRAGAGR